MKRRRIFSILLSASMVLQLTWPAAASELSAEGIAAEGITDEQVYVDAEQEYFFEEEELPVEAEAEELFIQDEDLSGELIFDEPENSGFAEEIQAWQEELLAEENSEPETEVFEEEEPLQADISAEPLAEEAGTEIQEIPEETQDEIEEDVLSSDAEDPQEAGAGKVTPHWAKVGDNYFWMQADGKYLREGGWHVFNGKRYFLAYKSGRRWSGWLTYSKKQFYLDPATGVLVTGKKAVNGGWYYFKETGNLPGEMMKGLLRVNDKIMFAQDSGRLVSGWRNVKGKKYYFNSSREAVSEWQNIGGKRYFFDRKNCYLRKGWLNRGKNVYYLLSDGTPKTGACTIGGKKYYFNVPYGNMYRGWRTANNHRYYYGQTGELYLGLKAVDGKIYYFNPTWGYIQTGWRTINNNRYFFGSDGSMVTGVQNIGGSYYLFNSDGTLVTNKRAYKINGTYFNIDANGVATALTKKAEILAAQRLDALGWSLPAAFNWAVSMTYYRGAPESVPSGYTPAEFYAEYGFEHGYGHCYMMACVFYEMASMLGYRVRFLKGYVPSSSGSVATHGWVEIFYNGGWYVCDPNFTYNTGRSGYMINYGYSGTWRYINYYVADQNF
ncbi:MAG: hypothetical protein IJ123_04990 [Blautia sp.]|nr:hypothetical protein [Blautia sp.]